MEGIPGIVIVLYLAVVVLIIASWWKIFAKAGEPGWACIVPIYNAIVLLRIVDRPTWWIWIILLVPIANIVVLFIVYIELAKKFGKDTGFGIGIILLGIIFLPMLAFGDAQYEGHAELAM